MIDALDDIDWKGIFYLHRGDAGGGKNKFTRLHEPVPMVVDYQSNVFRVMEWITRYGRATPLTQSETALLLPVGDQWFTSNIQTEEGVFYHCCEPQKFFQYYENYRVNFLRFMEQPRKAFCSTPYLTISRDMLWSMFNCIGKNYHYAKINPIDQDDISLSGGFKTITNQTVIDEVTGKEWIQYWKGEFYLPDPTTGLKQIREVSKHRCSRCPAEIPKRARAMQVIKNIV